MIRLVLLAALLALPSAARAEPPLILAHQGYFYVGGHTVSEGGRDVVVDDMFVEFQIPAEQSHPWPIVMVHGGGTTGAIFMGTPDGREGWAEYFLRLGYAVYVIDQPAQGRSAYDATADGPLALPPPGGTERMFTAPEKFGLWPQAKLHTQFPGTGLPGDPIYQQTLESSQAAIGDSVRVDAINRDALAALLDRIGPAVILTHSRSGPFGWLAADARPHLVKAIVAVEPNGPPFKNPASQAGTALPSAQGRPWGITYTPLTFDPPIADPAALAPVEAKPEAPDLLGCWEPAGAPHTLPRLAHIPILILTSEASYHAQYDQCTSQFLTRAGVANNHVRLESLGIHGNGHLMMWEKNNLQVAGVIEGWLEHHGEAK